MKRPLIASGTRPGEVVADFEIGLDSTPHLADHAFRDMAVLPGAYYIEMALRLERELAKEMPRVLLDIAFRHPIILSSEDSLIRVEAKERDGGRVDYTFIDGDAGGAVAATLAVLRGAIPEAPRDADDVALDEIPGRAEPALQAEPLYAALRRNGNQYGPHFRNVSALWRAKDEVLAELRAPSGMGRDDCLDPRLVDSAAQLLAAFALDEGRTFIWRSIARLDIVDPDLSVARRAHAKLTSRDGEGALRGDVRVLDRSGKALLRLSGVAISFLEGERDEPRPPLELVVASNFTAEPLEDSLRFWGEHFAIPIQVEFAPYNQVFQQLLDPGSAFHANRDGANVVLVGLEEWLHGAQHLLAGFHRERMERSFGPRPRHVLANGLEIVHLHRYETEYVYQEIFEDECYLRHGIRLEDGATVVDIGANIGLFSLFVMSRCANPKVYAFEPAPIVYDLLRANCEAYGSNVVAINAGVADRAKTATLTFYEKSSVFSGFHSDESVDRDAIKAVVRNMLGREALDVESIEQYVDELTADRVRGKAVECRMVSLSDVIREHAIEKIDLLKVDAEKSELDILAGIAEADWPKIGQVVMEIHDPTREAIGRVERLLAAKGFHCAVEQETLLEHAGLFNLYAVRREAASGPRAVTPLERNVLDFRSALAAFMERSRTPLFLCIAPRSPAALADVRVNAALAAAEEELLAAARAIPNVHAMASGASLALYPVRDYHDPHTGSHHAGHVPYTPEGYAAIGTTLIRALYNLARTPAKVIVLDCDNTLWKGVSGEDGPKGVEITPPYRALQEFMVGRMKAGMLLCLCSKNNEKDALDVFDQRPDMALRREHLATWRIDWNGKAENIKALANELNLGLDSFVFVDDNPVECAEVRIHCPEVVTLQLPRNAESFAAFLDHAWAFDLARGEATREDRSRTELYRQNAERERHRAGSFSLKDFVAGLQLRIEIAAATEEQVSRISQMTLRTNQFNFTTIRRTEAEIRAFLARKDAACLAVRVADRFGDYGLVGVLLYEPAGERCLVDTFLVSCRVLGRGVEHAIVAHLGRRAAAEGKAFVEFDCPPTEKNQPARQFIASIGEGIAEKEGTRWIFPVDRLAAVAYDPEAASPVEAAQPPGETARPRKARSPWDFGATGLSERLQRIGENLYDIDRISAGIGEYRRRMQPLAAGEDVAAGDTLENSLASIWKRVLGRSRIGLNENFFEAGGTSLRAVQVIALVKKELGRTLPVVTLFECPTVALLAAKLGAPAAGAAAATSAAAQSAAERGAQRRNRMRKR